MKVPYIEKICKHCPLKGTVSEPILFEGYGFIRYIDCQRDNEGVKELFKYDSEKANELLARQIGMLEHCMYAYNENIKEL